MDIGRSFTYPVDDPKWVPRVAVGALLTLASAIPIVNIFTGLVLTGYGLRVLKMVANGSDSPLPKWDDWGGDWIKGFLVAVAAIIYSVPIWLVSGAGAGIEALSRSGATEGVAALCVTGLSCLAALWGVAMAVVFPAAVIHYTKSGEFGSFFRFGEIFGFVSANLGNYIIAILISAVAAIAAGMLVILFVVGAVALGVILSIVGIFAAMFWASLVSSHLFGQVCAEAPALTVAAPTAEGEAASYGELEEGDFQDSVVEDSVESPTEQ